MKIYKNINPKEYKVIKDVCQIQKWKREKKWPWEYLSKLVITLGDRNSEWLVMKCGQWKVLVITGTGKN